jgi:predicted regulator of Ras-like GTPase activity (Roadblock/LC7/MglB family)
VTEAPAPASKEAKRDMEDTSFTPTLRALIRNVPAVIATAFVDYDGECIDYCSTAVSAYETKVVGAHLLVLAKMVQDSLETLSGGIPVLTHVVCSQRELFVRRVSLDYTLVVVTRRIPHQSETISMIETTVAALRVEGQIERPTFETSRRAIFVDVRSSPWGFAPTVLYDRGDRIEIVDVLGRWSEGSAPNERVGFLTRTERGDELVLLCDPVSGKWERR